MTILDIFELSLMAVSTNYLAKYPTNLFGSLECQVLGCTAAIHKNISNSSFLLIVGV